MANTPPKKYDFAKLKIDFFKSKHLNVTAFCDSIWLNSKSWHFTKKMKWWAEEKKVLSEEVSKIAQENLKQEMIKLYSPNPKELAEVYKAVMQTFKAKAFSNVQKIKKMPDWTIIIPPDVSMSENKLIWEIIKTERWEPIRVTKDDFVPPADDEQEWIQFYLPNNERDQLN